MYEVIKTGSTGNCVRVGDVLLDCGVPFKNIEHLLDEINVIFITHMHKDHFNKSTVDKIIKQYPKILVVGYGDSPLFHYSFSQTVEHKNGTSLKINIDDKERVFRFYFNFHKTDMSSMAIDFLINDERVLYATDLANTLALPDKIRYNKLFIEMNYDEKLVYYLKRTRRAYTDSCKSHLSKQQALNYIAKHTYPTSEVIPLHSSTLVVN